jgi:glucokinase
MRVISGDIGGTKTILAVADVDEARVHVIEERRFASRDFVDFTPLIQEFLSGVKEKPPCACFGVAGPVVEGRSEVTKLPWVLAENELERSLGLHRVRLINDFVAVAYGIEALRPEDLETLNAADPVPGGTVAVLGAGTGLGESIVMQTGGKRLVVASEGGHTDFAPRNDVEIEFLRWMMARYGHVSYDRVLSGPGIADIYTFFRDTGKEKESNELRRALAEADDPKPVIHRFANEKNDALCEATLTLFVSVYGAEAGNLALKAVATGGVYVAGGIAPRMIERLKRGEFQHAYEDKGRTADIVRAIPVYAVMNPKVGLLGAASAAAEL